MHFQIDKLAPGTERVFFQVALLYTTSTRQRRIRVHTLALPVTDDMAVVHACADAQAITCLLAKLGTSLLSSFPFFPFLSSISQCDHVISIFVL
jgi:hypothetical protein